MRKASPQLTMSSRKQRRLSFGNCFSPRELVPESARNYYQPFVEPPQSQSSISSFTPRKPVNLQTLSYRMSQYNTPTSATPQANDGLPINKKLIKGYSKFLEDKEFLSRRDEERQKVQQDIQESLANEEKKIISKGIQRLISSAIINDPNKRPKSVLKLANNDSEDCEVNKYDEKHKQVCNRILGSDFENGLLFMKVQRQNSANLKSQKSFRSYKKSDSAMQNKDSPAQTKGTSFFVGAHKRNDQSTAASSNLLKSPSGLALCTFNDSSKEKEEAKKPASVENGLSVPSLNLLGIESTRETDAPATLSELVLPSSTNYSHTKLSEMLLENDKKPVKLGTTRGKRLLVDASDSSFNKELKGGRTERFKQSTSGSNSNGNGKIFEANLHRNLKTKMQIPKFGKKYKSVLEENNENTSRSSSQLLTTIVPVKEGIDKLNRLCEGAIKSTNRLGIKLRQQHLKTGKEYGNLDILMEKLSYENTIQNWEKSVRKVNRMGEKGSLGNI